MRAVIQRVSSASVSAGNRCLSEIGRGLVILVGIEEEDSEVDAGWLAAKIVQLRIFDDNNGIMNLPVTDAHGQAISTSTLTRVKVVSPEAPPLVEPTHPLGVTFGDQALYRQWLQGLALAIGGRGSSLYFTANQQKAAIAVAAPPAAVWAVLGLSGPPQ